MEGNYMNTNEKIMSVLGYFGILFLIPLLAGGNTQFTRYHANQGLVLFIFNIVLCIIAGIIVAVITAINGLAGLFVSPMVFGVASLVVLVFTIIGIVHSAQGEMKPLPVIGGIQIIK